MLGNHTWDITRLQRVCGCCATVVPSATGIEREDFKLYAPSVVRLVFGMRPLRSSCLNGSRLVCVFIPVNIFGKHQVNYRLAKLYVLGLFAQSYVLSGFPVEDQEPQSHVHALSSYFFPQRSMGTQLEGHHRPGARSPEVCS